MLSDESLVNIKTMKTTKGQLNAIEKLANKILDKVGEIKVFNIKPPKEVAQDLQDFNTDQDIAEDKVHEEEVVEPQDPTEVPSL
jgi:small nuclear ribonucleoprotein (snRNP)-like protein